MDRPVAVGPARPDELAGALHAIFRHVPEEDRDQRVAHVLDLISLGEVDPAGVLVARGRQGLCGAMICQPLAGAGGLVWPPQSLPGKDGREIEDRLVHSAAAWLRSRGAKLAQALLPSAAGPSGAALERNGYRCVTRLLYLRHYLDLPATLLTTEDRLSFVPYSRCTADEFHETLLRTYVETLDCPEVNGVRDLTEILAGHRAQGKPDAHHWWLARTPARPVGVLLATELLDAQGWDISYLGLVPEARGHGLGKELVRKALFEARAADALLLTLAVDDRNWPARDLYRRMGFETFDSREVYLTIWQPAGSS
jgi:ribosomal protein S18 acetylase RimI-like enzyme